MSTASCGSAGGQSACARPSLSLKNDGAAEKQIQAAKGGWIKLKDDSAAVYIMPGSLDHDATIVMTPVAQAPSGVSNVTHPGFELEEKGTGSPPQLKGPVEISFPLSDPNENASVFKYSGDSSEPVDADIIPAGANSSITAFVDLSSNGKESCSFAYGKQKSDQQSLTATTGKPLKRSKSKNQVNIDADAISPYTTSGQLGTWVFNSHLTLSANCDDAVGWSGNYNGTFNLSVKGNFQQVAGLPYSLNMPVDVTASGDVSFSFSYPKDNPQLELLLQQAQKDTGLSSPDLFGQGTLHTSQSLGNVSASGSGPGASVGFNLQTTDGGQTWPVVVVINPGENKVFLIWAMGTYSGTISTNSTVFGRHTLTTGTQTDPHQ